MMKRQTWIIMMIAFLLGPVSAAYALNEFPRFGPGMEVFANFNFNLLDEAEGDDWHFNANEVSFGARGIYLMKDMDWLMVPYNLEIEVTDAVNDSDTKDDVKVKQAMFVFATKKYGALAFVARGQSGHQIQLYNPVDIFEKFEANANSGLYMHPMDSTGMIGYTTPTYHGFMLGVVQGTVGNGMNDNDKYPDSLSWRLIYDHEAGPGRFYAGIGQIQIDKGAITGLPFTADGEWDKYYNQYAATMKYTWNAGHQIAAHVEAIRDYPHPLGGEEFETYGIAGRVKLPANFDVGLGYYFQEGDRENSAVVGNVRYHVSDRVYGYAEFAKYDEDNPDRSYVGLGVSVKMSAKPMLLQ